MIKGERVLLHLSAFLTRLQQFKVLFPYRKEKSNLEKDRFVKLNEKVIKLNSTDLL